MFKKLRKIVLRKSFIGSFIFAFALWGYTSLNTEYRTYVKIPLKVKLPENRAIENAFPGSVSVEVKGSGWHLFNLIFFNTAAVCYVDLADAELTDAYYEVGRNDMIKSLQFLNNVSATNVLPERLSFKTGALAEITVPIKPALHIVPRDGFLIAGSPRISPENVQILGNEKVVKNISSWATRPIEKENANEPFTMVVPVSDSMKNLVNVFQNFVTVSVDIQQRSSMTIPDVEVKLRGGSLPVGHKLIPEFITVTVQGGIKEITAMSIESIRANIDFSDVLNDSTGIIVPRVSAPDNIRIVSFNPPYLHHVIKVPTQKELLLTNR